MPYADWPEHPRERRCINCDQRLIADPEAATAARVPAEPVATPGEPACYVCPDGHERWAYNAESLRWDQMY